jgi:hypothetical protein
LKAKKQAKKLLKKAMKVGGCLSFGEIKPSPSLADAIMSLAKKYPKLKLTP